MRTEFCTLRLYISYAFDFELNSHGCRGSEDYNRAEMIELSHTNEFPDLSRSTTRPFQWWPPAGHRVVGRGGP
jgi:hypothetical protein